MPSQSSRPSAPPSRRARRELERASTPRVRSRASAPKKPPAWQSPIVLVSVVAVAAIALVLVLTRKAPPSTADLQAPPVQAAGTAAAALADGEELGRADAPVKLEIWSDFQCPICGTLVKDYFPRLITDFVLPGQVRIVAHDIAILGTGADNESVNAGAAALCAGQQGKYWQYHDYLFYNQNGENQGWFNAERLGTLADMVGLDRTAWDSCIAGQAMAQQVRANTTQAAQAGIRSTPSFRVAGGQVTSGLPRTYADFAALIRAALPSSSPTSSAGAGAASPAASATVGTTATPAPAATQ